MTKKILGDAGEHYALSQFSFAGMFAAKMPDNWVAYDLAVETGEGLARVSVKTRSETDAWEANSWFIFDDRKICDWLVFIFKPKTGPLHSWIIPFEVALEYANKPGENRKDRWSRDISWAKLQSDGLIKYKENWQLLDHGAKTKLVRKYEGGSVSLVKKSEGYVLEVDQAAAYALLDKDDRQGIEPYYTITFSSKTICDQYLRQRGWN